MHTENLEPGTLLERVRHTLATADRTAALATHVPDPKDDSPLRVALVGPYNAGKSLLVAALLRMPAGQADTISGAKPHTVDITPYPWRGHHLLDLPGTLSGLDEHDGTSRRGVRTADALLIVTTVELPGDDEAAAIRQLLDRDGFRGRCVIAINKASSENSDRNVIRTEMEQRIGTSDEIPLVFTDARDYLDAANDPQLTEDDRSMLQEDSGILDLEEAVQAMLRQTPSPRVTAQLQEALRVIDDALTVWDPAPEEEILEATAARAQTAINTARTDVEEAVDRALATLEDSIRTIGEDLAAAIDPDKGTIAKTDSDKANAAEQRHHQRFADSVNSAIDDALTQLATQIEAAFEQQQQYEQTLRGRRRRTEQPITPTSTDRVVKELLTRIGATAGDKLNEFVKSGTRPGSPLHDFARWVNNTLGKKAMPYTHVHTAEGMSKGLSFVNTVLDVLGPAIDVKTLLDDVSRRRQIDQRTNDIRASYQSLASDLLRDERSRVLDHVEMLLAPLVKGAEPQIREAQNLRASREDARSDLTQLRQTVAGAIHHLAPAGRGPANT